MRVVGVVHIVLARWRWTWSAVLAPLFYVGYRLARRRPLGLSAAAANKEPLASDDSACEESSESDGASDDDSLNISSAIPPPFVVLAEQMPAPVRSLLIENVAPECVSLPSLLRALGLPVEGFAEYPELRSLKLMRLARGLPAEPPRIRASSAELIRQYDVLTPRACAALRAAVDAERAVASDSVDGAPDHQVRARGREASTVLISRHAWRLAA